MQKFLQVSLSLCWKRRNRVSNRFQQVHVGTLRSWRDHDQASSWFDYVLEATRNCYWTPLWEVWWKMCNLRFLYTSLHTCVSLWWVQLRILPRLMCYLRRSGSSDTMKDSNIYIEMKWKWRKEAESEEQRMNESVMHREAEDEIIALFYYLLLLNCLHYYFSLYICSIERYCTENMLSFTLNIMLTILIANLLTLGIIRTVDIFTTLKWKPFELETCTNPHYLMFNFYQINKDGEILTRDRLVIKALIPCQRIISTQ